MTKPDPLEIIKKYGKAAVAEHLAKARGRAAEIKQTQWEIDQVLDTIDNRIQGLSKGQRRVAGDGASRAVYSLAETPKISSNTGLTKSNRRPESKVAR